MPIIGNVEKKNIKVKILGLAIHLILILGGITMIYPLLIMISGSLKSDVDFNDFSIAPEYVYAHPSASFPLPLLLPLLPQSPLPFLLLPPRCLQ